MSVEPFLPSGERLSGWHFVDGSAAKLGLGDRFGDADVDIAGLFALRSTRGALSANDLAVLSNPVKAPLMGRLEGALLTRLPLELARRELRALVDDDVVSDFLAGHGPPSPHATSARTRPSTAHCSASCTSCWARAASAVHDSRRPSRAAVTASTATTACAPRCVSSSSIRCWSCSTATTPRAVSSTKRWWAGPTTKTPRAWFGSCRCAPANATDTRRRPR